MSSCAIICVEIQVQVVSILALTCMKYFKIYRCIAVQVSTFGTLYCVSHHIVKGNARNYAIAHYGALGIVLTLHLRGVEREVHRTMRALWTDWLFR